MPYSGAKVHIFDDLCKFFLIICTKKRAVTQLPAIFFNDLTYDYYLTICPIGV